MSDLWCVLVGALGGTIFGYSTGIIGGMSTPLVCQSFADSSPEHNQYFTNGTSVINICGLSINKAYWSDAVYDDLSSRAKLSSEQTTLQGLLTACILVGAFAGAFIGPGVSNRYGRKMGLLLTGLITIASSITLGLISNFWALVGVRTVQGIAVGLCSTVAPLYVSEMSSDARRSKLGTVFQLFICGSILIAQFVNYLLVPSTSADLSSNANQLAEWSAHLQLGLAAVPGLFLLIVSQFVPESTVWAAEKESNNQSINMLNDPLAADDMDQPMNGGNGPSQWSLLLSASGWKWCWIAIILSMANQLTGINGIVFYAPQIFATHFPNDALVLTFTAVGAWNFLSVFLSFLLVDRFSRKNLLLATLGLMCVATGVLAVMDMDIGALKSVSPYISIICVMLFVGAFECGIGPLFWVMAVDTFPSNIEQAALSFTNATVWICNIALTFAFPIITSALGQSGTFFLLSGIALGATILIAGFVPKGANKEAEIEENSPNRMTDEDDLFA